MFRRLQQKWNVTRGQFWIIFTVFAITGTTTAYLTKAIISLLGFDENTWWVWKVLLRLAMLLIGYWILLLIIGSLFGQYKFFSRFIRAYLEKIKILKKNSSGLFIRDGEDSNSPAGTKKDIISKMTQKPIIKIAIFASGAGSNAQEIFERFENHDLVQVGLVVCNIPTAGVLQKAAAFKIPVLLIEKDQFFKGDHYLPKLHQAEIDFIVLAGFLWKVPEAIIDTYRNKIINIHPALLPKFGGKGMYGSRVHRAVIENGEKESGITIHYVDEHFDNGDTIFQAKCPVFDNDTPETLAQRIHALEHTYFPETIEKLLLSRNTTA